MFLCCCQLIFLGQFCIPPNSSFPRRGLLLIAIYLFHFAELRRSGLFITFYLVVFLQVAPTALFIALILFLLTRCLYKAGFAFLFNIILISRSFGTGFWIFSIPRRGLLLIAVYLFRFAELRRSGLLILFFNPFKNIFFIVFNFKFL